MQDKDPSTMIGYFSTMEELVTRKNSNVISSRVRFMLQDVIDLRKNRWIPRRIENKPKTIQQIQFEAESEKMGINLNKKPLSIMEKSSDERKTVLQKDWNKPSSAPYKANYSFDKTKLMSMRVSINNSPYLY